MKLYIHPISQHARRVLMLCRELGLTIDTATVALDTGEHKQEPFTRLSRTSKVPVLEDGDFRLAESHAIMKYLAGRSEDHHLYPSDPKKRALIDMWLDWNHTALNPPIQTVAIQTLFMKDNADKAIVAKAREQAHEALDRLDLAVKAKDGIGGSPNLADLSITSTLGLYEMVGGEISRHPAVTTWFETMKQRPSFRETAPKM